MFFTVIFFPVLCMLTRPKLNHLFFLRFSLSGKLKCSLILRHLVVTVTRNAEIHHKLQHPSHSPSLFIHPLSDLCVPVMIRGEFQTLALA